MSPELGVVPQILCPGDPTAQDGALRVPGSFDDWIRWGGTGTPEELETLEQRFHRCILDSAPEAAELAALLRVDHPIRHTRQPPREAEVTVPDEMFADAVEDLVPDVGVLGERITGVEGAADVLTGAVACCLELFENRDRPVDRWARDEPDRALSRSARAIAATPPCVWSDGPRLPLAPQFVPTSVPSGAYVARFYRYAGAWVPAMVMALPRAPGVAPIVRRLRLELWRLRLGDRGVSWEDFLCRRPDVVYRAAAEGAR